MTARVSTISLLNSKNTTMADPAKVAAVFQKIVKLSKPEYKHGSWRKPVLSRRKIAVLRKKFLLQGYEWDDRAFLNYRILHKDERKVKPPKGHKHQRELDKRFTGLCSFC
jgi:hypothetical protein